jgi:hypothetical protein
VEPRVIVPLSALLQVEKQTLSVKSSGRNIGNVRESGTLTTRIQRLLRRAQHRLGRPTLIKAKEKEKRVKVKEKVKERVKSRGEVVFYVNNKNHVLQPLDQVSLFPRTPLVLTVGLMCISYTSRHIRKLGVMIAV